MINACVLVLLCLQQKVRRKAISALGEFLFYVAAQQQGQSGQVRAKNITLFSFWSFFFLFKHSICHIFFFNKSDDAEQWMIPGSSIAIMIRSLRQTEDDIVRHYTAKAIENILAQSPLYSRRFATQEVKIPSDISKKKIFFKRIFVYYLSHYWFFFFWRSFFTIDSSFKSKLLYSQKIKSWH